MKTIKYTLITPSLMVMLFSLLIVGCKEEEFDASFNPSRAFTPGAITITNGQTRARIEWDASLFSEGKGLKYTVQASKVPTFAAIDYTVVTDSTGVYITDANVAIKQDYYVRVKANATGSSAESNWMVGATTFMVTGEQIFIATPGTDIKNNSVTLKWTATAAVLTKIVLTPSTGAAIEVTLNGTDNTARTKQITGLTPGVSYTAEIFAGTVSKGTTTFQTKDFTLLVTPADNLVTVVANAANNERIGLEAGTYDCTALPIEVRSKFITLASASGNPADTKINFKEVTLKGSGAGVKISGIEFDGTAGAAAYFINVTGVLADAELVNLVSVQVDNCIIHSTTSALFRGNRGANNGYKIDFIKFDNNIIYDNGTGGFDYILLDKMEFKTLELTRTTFYNSGRRLISWATNITVPQIPTILIDKVTVNSLGFGARDYVILDANGNAVNFTLRNSIIANIPKAGQTVGNNAFRVGTGSTVSITNNNMFKITNGASPAVPLTFATAPVNNKTTDLGWTNATTTFALPAGSDLRTSSTTGGPIGDPRWAQ